MKMQNLNEHLDEVQEKIDYYFNNTDLLLQAFTRSSYSTQYGGENNEVLEFIGDKVLDFYVIKTIVDEFGFMKSQSEYYDKDNDNEEFCIVAHKNSVVMRKRLIYHLPMCEGIYDISIQSSLVQ